VEKLKSFYSYNPSKYTCVRTHIERSSVGYSKQHLVTTVKRDVIVRSWPNNISNLPQLLHEFWNDGEDLYIRVTNDLILMGSHLVIPSSRR